MGGYPATRERSQSTVSVVQLQYKCTNYVSSGTSLTSHQSLKGSDTKILNGTNGTNTFNFSTKDVYQCVLYSEVQLYYCYCLYKLPVNVDNSFISLNWQCLFFFFLALPSYNAKKIQYARAGQPFEFDFNYTSPLPPSLFRWYKNGKVLTGDGGRVTVEHTGISFTHVLPTDAGQYMVKASIKSALVTALSTLQGESFKDCLRQLLDRLILTSISHSLRRRWLYPISKQLIS